MNVPETEVQDSPDRVNQIYAKALLERALEIRDLRVSIKEAIMALERKSPETARQLLVQALDGIPLPFTSKRREG